MDRSALIALISIVALLAMLGFWCLMLWMLSRISGWYRLASRYASRRVPSGRRFGWQSARFAWVGYNNCLTMHASVEGLFIQPWTIFQLAHPALLIPWAELKSGSKRRSFGIDWVDFRLQQPDGFKLALPARVLAGQNLKLA